MTEHKPTPGQQLHQLTRAEMTLHPGLTYAEALTRVVQQPEHWPLVVAYQQSVPRPDRR